MTSPDYDPAPLADPGVRRVALVRLRVGLGDLLCSIPALRVLREARPDLRVTMITWAEMAPVVERMRPYVDELLPFPGAPGIPDRTPHEAGWAPFVAAAEQRELDLALQVYGDNPAANAVTAALGARRVGGFAPRGWTPVRDPALHVRYPTHLHEVGRHLRVLQRLGIDLPADAQRRTFPTTPAEDAAAAALRDRHGLARASYAVLHPGGSSPSRRWPAERFAAVADRLTADGLRVVVTGVAGERSLTAQVAAGADVVDLSGATGLGELAALLRDAAVVVANDTGTAHLAAAVGTPSVTLFLPGDPVRWAYPEPRHRAVRAAVGCNPCPHLVCPIDHRCATRISVGSVVEAVRAARRADSRRTGAEPARVA